MYERKKREVDLGEERNEQTRNETLTINREIKHDDRGTARIKLSVPKKCTKKGRGTE